MKHTILIFSGIAIAFLLLVGLARLSLSGGLALTAENSAQTYLVSIVAFLLIVIGYGIHRLVQKNPPNLSENTFIDERALLESGLSDREHEILKLISKGLSNSEISAELHISESTVKSHVSSVLSKLNARRRTEAVRIAKDLYIIH